MSTPQPDTVGFGLAISLLVLLGIIGAYELYALFMLPGDASVTFYIRAWSQQVLLLPLTVGIVLGHLFFPVRLPPPHP